MSIKKVAAFTGIRSDYDLMSGLYKKINDASDMELGLIVSGAHLSETYGYTVKYIEEDKLPILARIESLLDSNSPASRLKSASILLQNCIHTLQSFNPDVILYPGDREDVIVGALAGAYLNIPTVHFFGGDHAADGNVDNPIRHAASKLSSLHFVSHISHKERLLKIGEADKRIFVVGSPAIDKFFSTESISKKQLLSSLGRPGWDEYALVIFHPILGEEKYAGKHFEEILYALKEKCINAFVSYPNVDAGNKKILDIIAKYQNEENFCFYKNLERKLFINLMRNSMFMIGNSSSGLIEAPAIQLGAINVGLRQKGRLATGNVIFIEQGINNILQSIDEVLSADFQKKLKKIVSPYGVGDSIFRSFDLLRSLVFSKYIYKTEDPLKE